MPRAGLEDVDDCRRAELERTATEPHGLEEHLTDKANRQRGHRERPETTRHHHVAVEPPPIPSNATNLTPWTKSNFLAAAIG